mmetsp:Transcript_17789/g.29736  ORF Transcript_17789/g.29736 Transcript_17789/m.29736 type:complete len:461 (+) Transcript_17789:98-1480(+)
MYSDLTHEGHEVFSSSDSHIEGSKNCKHIKCDRLRVHSHSHSISKAHQRQLVKELATKLHHLESVVQVELPALQQQLSEKEQESILAFDELSIAHEKQIAELRFQIQHEKEANIVLARSIIKSNLRNKHLSEEYEQIKEQQVSKDREIRILKESIVDLRTVMTRLPSSSSSSVSSHSKKSSVSPDDSSSRSSSRLLKRKVGSADMAEAKVIKGQESQPAVNEHEKENINEVTIQNENSKNQPQGEQEAPSAHETAGGFSQRLLEESEAQLERTKQLLSKKINEIAYLKNCNTCHVCSTRLNESSEDNGSARSGFHGQLGARVQTPDDQRTPPGGLNTTTVLQRRYKGESVLESGREVDKASAGAVVDLSPPRVVTVFSANNTKELLGRKDKQIAFYRKKLSESYDELELERKESKVTLRYLTKKLDNLNSLLAEKDAMYEGDQAKENFSFGNYRSNYSMF